MRPETLPENRDRFDRDWCHDYVVSHGEGRPTEEAYELAEKLYRNGDSYADIAFEVVARGMTIDSEVES